MAARSTPHPASTPAPGPAPSALRRTARIWAALALCLLAALGPGPAAAAKPGPAAKPAPSAPAAAKGELVFGMSAAFSGSNRGLGVDYACGILAAFAHVNAQGGADGRRLALSLRDDGYGPAEALRNTIAFVEEERVFALLGYVGTPTTARVMPLLKRYSASGMVLLFPLTGADLLREPPHDACVFNLRPSYVEETGALVEALLAAGKRRIAVFHQADVYGRNGWDGVRRTLAAHGLSIVSEATYRRGASFTQNFRREAGIIQAGRPDAVVTVGTAPASAAFIRDARDAGMTATIAALSFADADHLVQLLLGQGRAEERDYASGLVFSQVVPCYEDAALPLVRLYRKVMGEAHVALPAGLVKEAYEPHPHSFVCLEGFLAGLVLAEAVKRMEGTPSPLKLRRALSGLHGLDVGMGERVDFRPGSNQGLRRTYLTVYDKGGFKGVERLPGGAQ